MKNASSFELVIPEAVEAKIRHLCSKVHDVEWSGTLFYTVEGSLDDGTFKATCVDICVMDIGTAGFTEFKDTEDIISYRLEHRETLLVEGVYEALIHSHNNMPAFFSGTDESTLISEGTDLNHFLSLIVCNAGQYVARITRKLKTKLKAEAHIVYTKSAEYNTYDNQTVVLSSEEVNEVDKTEEKEETVIEYFELRINKAEVAEPFKEIDERLTEIKTKKSKKYPRYYEHSWDTLDEEGPAYNLPSSFPRSTTPRGVAQGKQLTIFGQEGKKEAEEEKPILDSALELDADSSFEELAPAEFYLTERVPHKITKTLCTQLLFGSILADGDANIDLTKFVRKMDKVYERRFGNLVDEFNYYRLSNWIDAILEQLIGYSVDKDYEDEIAKKYNLGTDYEYEESDSFVHLYAHSMIIFLNALPESDVKEMMIDSLINLMPREYAGLTEFKVDE